MGPSYKIVGLSTIESIIFFNDIFSSLGLNYKMDKNHSKLESYSVARIF